VDRERDVTEKERESGGFQWLGERGAEGEKESGERIEIEREREREREREYEDGTTDRD
jgi:hypothetical protein